jgi:hypothetical protein
MKKLLVLGLMLMLTSPAMAGWVVTNTGPVNSMNVKGSAENIVFTASYTQILPGGDTIGTLDFVGDLTKVLSGTYASEARFNIKNMRTTQFYDAQPTTITSFTGTIHIVKQFTGLATTFTMPWLTGDTIRFEAFEYYNDGAGADSYWTNLSFDFQQPTPPPPVFSGNFLSTPNTLVHSVPQNGTTIWNHLAPQPGLTDGAGEAPHAYVVPPGYFSYTEVGNEVGYRVDHAGGDFIIDMVASTDLDVYVMNSTGLPANCVASSTGGSTEHLVFSAPAGTYYVAVDTYGSTNSGSAYEILYTPEPGTLALFGLGLLGLIRRR